MDTTIGSSGLTTIPSSTTITTPISSDSFYQSTYNRIKHHDTWAFVIAIIFLFIAVAMIIITVLYFLYWRPPIPATSCQSDNNCSIGQICQSGFCVEQICTSNSDCNSNGLCINSYCTSFNCLVGNDCPTGTACTNGSCVKIGGSCQSNSDCFGLSCMNQVCSQCLTNSNCPSGQGCFNNVCRYPYDGETGPSTITYISPAQNNGNITAPPGYFCPSLSCGTGPNTQDPFLCGNDSDLCPASCPFCVNSVCRCTSGALLEECRSNSDCASGLCSHTDNGKLCVPLAGECAFNYNGTGGIKVCPISKPYCVNGTCSSVSLGAFCGSTGLPFDICNNPQSLGSPGITGITQNGMGFFCVNGTCQENPGGLNSLCTPGSCTFIDNGALVCTPVITGSIPEMRCLTI